MLRVVSKYNERIASSRQRIFLALEGVDKYYVIFRKYDFGRKNIFSFIFSYLFVNLSLLSYKGDLVVQKDVRLVSILVLIIRYVRRGRTIIDVDDYVSVNFYSRLKFKLYDLFVYGSYNIGMLDIPIRKRVWIPTGVETDQYRVSDLKSPVVIWVGTPFTSKYLDSLFTFEFAKAFQRTGWKFKAVGYSGRLEEDYKDFFTSYDWSHDMVREIAASARIGVMPLMRNEGFSHYKCAYKLLEYCAMKLEIISEQVGANKTVEARYRGEKVYVSNGSVEKRIIDSINRWDGQMISTYTFPTEYTIEEVRQRWNRVLLY